MSYSIFIGRELSGETRKWLHSNNVAFTEKPLIKIEFLLPDFLFFNQLKNKEKSFVITSRWAAHWLKKYNSEIGIKSADSIFCISQKKADVLSELSNDIFISKEKNAKSLAELVNENCKEKAVVYLKGDKSLNTLQTEIDSEKIQLFKTEVYRNLPIAQKLSADFDAYLFFSPSGIESFIEAGNLIPAPALVFTIGHTSGNRAKQIFTNQIIESPVQEEKAFVEFAVKELKFLQPETNY